MLVDAEMKHLRTRRRGVGEERDAAATSNRDTAVNSDELQLRPSISDEFWNLMLFLHMNNLRWAYAVLITLGGVWMYGELK
ncbi:hypothetical protein MRB53_005835 [Persea americana]|uniref:Uncharacterized protein n=1 Tax=Persea americana TaxID=3435 RepID=A0ACC2MG26_PERAE|nr:hypothetical protein MRB53_005835 [Persea americana]